MAKYQQLLRKHCSMETNIMNFMLTYITTSDYIRAQVYGNKPEDLPHTSLVWENAGLWHKIVQLHLREVEDLEHNVAALRNALPTTPNSSYGRIPVSAPNDLVASDDHVQQVGSLLTPRTICSP
jgi:hypothetical protein